MFATSHMAKPKARRKLRHKAGVSDVANCYPPLMKMRIKELRRQRGWTQVELAARVGMSPTYLSELENNVKPINSARMDLFARVFGIPVVDLIEGQEDREELQGLTYNFLQLSPEARKIALRIIRGMASDEDADPDRK